MSFDIPADYEPVHGDQITGSPALLSRYITIILSSGAHFQYVDGDTIEVIKPGKGEVIVPAPAAPATPAPAPVAEEAVEVAVEATETVKVAVEEAVAVIEGAVDTAIDAVHAAEEIVAPEAAPKRGRKPAVKAESTENVEE